MFHKINMYVYVWMCFYNCLLIIKPEHIVTIKSAIQTLFFSNIANEETVWRHGRVLRRDANREMWNKKLFTN